MALTGVVKKYDTAKGFGFIVPTGTSTDLFVLRTDVIGGTLQAGDKVNFDEGLNERTGKPKAIRVTGGSGPAPGGKGDPDGEKGSKGGGKGKRDKGKGGSKQPGALNGGLMAGPVPGGCGCPCPCPGPCGLMLGGCGLGAGKASAPMPGGCANLPDGVKSGIVKFFHDEKGFGFIKQDDGGNDLFVHRNDVIDTLLNEGDHVQYSEAVDNRSGRMKAHQVTGGSGAPKPPQEKGAGKGGKGKKGGKRSPPNEPSLPNPMPTLPDVPTQETSLSQKMGQLGSLTDAAAMFGCSNPAMLMGKGGFPSACCGCNPCGGCGDTQNKMGCCGGCGCGGLCGGCGCGGCGGGGCGGGCGGCGSACGGCGGCGQCMGGCGGNCGNLSMSGNSCNAGGCGCGCSSGNACNTPCNPGSAGSCNMPSSCCGCGGCSGCTGCGCGCGCNTGCCGCGGCCPNFNACGCSGAPNTGLGGCSLGGNNFEEDFDTSSMTMCRGGFSGLNAGSPSPAPPCGAGCGTGPCGVGVGPCGANWEGSLQQNLQGKAAAMAPFSGQNPEINSACFAQLMNVANLSGVAPNPNPSSGDRFPAGTAGAGSMAGSFMQGGGENNMPGPCFGSNTAGSGANMNAAVFERLASAAGGGGGGFEDYGVYGGQGSNNPLAARAGCFSNLAGPCSNHG